MAIKIDFNVLNRFIKVHEERNLAMKELSEQLGIDISFSDEEVLQHAMEEYSNYISNEINKDKVTSNDSAFKDAEKEVSSKIDSYLTNDGKRTVESLHKDLGQIMWNYCGMSRNQKDLDKALNEIKELKNTFWSDVKVPGKKDTLNAELEKADRVADFIELGDLMIRDALDRDESCGAHFREEYQTDDGEAMRDDKNFSYVSTWENKGDKAEPILHKEELLFDTVTPTQRSYK